MKIKSWALCAMMFILLLPCFSQKPEDNPDVFGKTAGAESPEGETDAKESASPDKGEARVIYSKPEMERFAIKGESFLIPQEKIHLGDEIRYIIQLSWEGKLGEIEVDEPDPPLLNNLKLMKVIPSNKISPETNRAIAEFTYLMNGLEKGKSYVGMIDASYRLKDGSGQGSLRIKEQRFEILPRRHNWKRIGLVSLSVLGILVATAAIGYGAFYLIKRRPAPAPAAEADVSSPYERIIGELSSMKLFLIEGEIRDFYSKLAKLAKGFLSVNQGEELAKLTTEEILQALQEKNFNPEQRDRIFAILELCDRVKFAGYVPTHSENEQALKELEVLIRNHRKM
ncbi:hypothetical protein JW926_05000 [Candidatus Sumerlaeota bacterium]|nr:hypothetical protein [Candidatus Sumerlaeota bacterium]